MDRNQLLEARILQAAHDAYALSNALADLTHKDVEAGPESEDRVRSLEQSIQNASLFVSRLTEFAKARPE